jgi:hypothetical protein
MPDSPENPSSRSASDKERSKQQSRPVSAKGAAKPAGGTAKKSAGPTAKKQSGGTAKTAPKNGSRPAAGKGGTGNRSPKPGGGRGAPPPRRSPATLMTWGLVGLVLVVLVVLVVVYIAGGNKSQTAGANYPAASSQLMSQVTSVPASVYDEVGVTAPSPGEVSPQTKLPGQKALVIDSKPGIYYFGAEYCPYCAAQRWGLLTGLARFGTWSGVGLMESSSTDVYPSTHTFTFDKATFTSKYVTFKSTEYYSNHNPTGTGYTVLQVPTKQEAALITKYDNSTYLPGVQANSFPFVDYGNAWGSSGAQFDPTVLQGLTWSQIASNLDDPTNPVTQSIIATANYVSAATCDIDGMVPSSVCSSKGVTEALKALKTQGSSS